MKERWECSRTPARRVYDSVKALPHREAARPAPRYLDSLLTSLLDSHQAVLHCVCVYVVCAYICFMYVYVKVVVLHQVFSTVTLQLRF